MIVFGFVLISRVILGVKHHTSFFFFKQKTAYEMRISDWSSDVCSSDLNGIGMSPEQIKSAFKAFERGSDPFVRASEGVGLGLALCSEIMRAHGGDIAMASRLGEGTTATARLPFDRVVLDLDAARYA